MSPTADYRCVQCGEPYYDLDINDPAGDPRVSTLCEGEYGDCELERIWTPPHTGRGSSGEPPR